MMIDRWSEKYRCEIEWFRDDVVPAKQIPSFLLSSEKMSSGIYEINRLITIL
jgi:hypothetical protein